MAQRQSTATSPARSSRSKKSRGEPDRDDELLARAYEASSWARRNTTTLVILGIVLALVVLFVVVWVNQQGQLTERAIVQLEQIQQTVAVGDPASARAELSNYISDFAGTPYAEEARLVLAELLLQNDQPQEALAALGGSSTTLRDPLGVQIAVLEGKAHEAAGQYDEAVATFLDVADEAELRFQRTEALADAARVRGIQGQWADAEQLYGRLLEDLPQGHPERPLYEMRRAEAAASTI
jgi:predicted negative regulator of RcsB-dependent stress response